jgi:hypothetical protein
MKSKVLDLIKLVASNKYWIAGAIAVPGSSIFIMYKILMYIRKKKYEKLEEAMSNMEEES